MAFLRVELRLRSTVESASPTSCLKPAFSVCHLSPLASDFHASAHSSDMLSMTRSVVILSSFSAAAWAAEQRLRGSNATQSLTSSGPCCSFDGCKSCADWCTQQGKDVCLAPQGAPGGGCDNSHSDPHAAPPQWCEAGAGELSANDAPVSDDVKLASGGGCGQFCCWWGSDCGTCGDDWNSRMYEAGCKVPCAGPNCGAHQGYFNAQAGALRNCNSPGFRCY